jgi:hypothetical protein
MKIPLCISRPIAVLAGFALIVSCSRTETRGKHELSLSGTNVIQHIDFPLVGSASNFFFYECVSGLQSLDRFVRFTVSRGDMSNQISLIIIDNNRKFKRSLPYLRTNLQAEIPQLPHKEELLWWAPEGITNGYYCGEMEAYAVKLWVDESGGTLFLYEGD